MIDKNKLQLNNQQKDSDSVEEGEERSSESSSYIRPQYANRRLICNVCKMMLSKYTCPRCQARTCGLTCLKKHKQNTGCTGRQAKQMFVELKDLDQTKVRKDYGYMKNMISVTDKVKKKITGLNEVVCQEPKRFKILKLNAKRLHGIDLTFAPTLMERHRNNISFYFMKTHQIFWVVQFIFLDLNIQMPLSDSTKKFDSIIGMQNVNNCDTNSKTSQKIKSIKKHYTEHKSLKKQYKYLTTPQSDVQTLKQIFPKQFLSKQLLNKQINTQKIQGFHFFIKANGSYGKPMTLQPVNIQIPLYQCLRYREIIQFPTFYCIFSLPNQVEETMIFVKLESYLEFIINVINIIGSVIFMHQEKKLRLIISQLKERELLRLFEIYLQQTGLEMDKNIKQISFNCFQSTLHIDGGSVNGYGKSANEALLSVIANYFDIILTDQHYQTIIRDCLRVFNQQTKQKVPEYPNKSLANQKAHSTHSFSLKNNYCEAKTNGRQFSNATNATGDNFFQQSYQSIRPQDISIARCSHSKGKGTTQKSTQDSIEPNELRTLMIRVAELEDKLAKAEEENAILKEKLWEQDKKYGQERRKQKNYDPENRRNEEQHRKYEDNKKYEHEASRKQVPLSRCLLEVSNRIENNERLRSQSIKPSSKAALSNNMNESFQGLSTTAQAKVRIPKLNLQVLPNYHGKSNKSLNHSLMESYQKKLKTVNA